MIAGPLSVPSVGAGPSPPTAACPSMAASSSGSRSSSSTKKSSSSSSCPPCANHSDLSPPSTPPDAENIARIRVRFLSASSFARASAASSADVSRLMYSIAPASSCPPLSTKPPSQSSRPDRRPSSMRRCLTSALDCATLASRARFHSAKVSWVTGTPSPILARSSSRISSSVLWLAFSSSIIALSWDLRTYPEGRAWRYLHSFPPLGHTQNHPYKRFSTASRKCLHTISVMLF
mmetsp:Transcript_9619/g.42035  ORF Transcript_9619/g.42035 Transcript_9619/m.42035 type:complete len:234 (-) Transcript_9619:826-1527(-)